LPPVIWLTYSPTGLGASPRGYSAHTPPQLGEDSIDVVREVLKADIRVRPHVLETRLLPSPGFDRIEEARVFFKCENLQHSGSFKVRGALSKALTLDRPALERGVITASTGNHGAAVSYALAQLDAKATVVVPEGTSTSKLANIRRHGGEIRVHGDDGVQSERFARSYAAEHGLEYLSPYNDLQVIAGQGTIGVELERQLDSVDVVIASVGGGGLVAGIAGYLKSRLPDVRIVGCSPVNSPVMIRSVEAGELLDLPSEPTLSDGTAGGIEADAITFPLVRDLVDDFVTVTEAEIAAAMVTFMDTHSLLIEGAAGVAVAAYRKLAETFRGKTVVVVLCGGNIGVDALRSVVCGPQSGQKRV